MRFAALVLLWSAMMWAQSVRAVISAQPPPNPAEVAQLEAQVQAHPDNLEARLHLLSVYGPSAPERLSHVLYLIEHFPADPRSSSEWTYVPAANAADHAAVRAGWLAAVDRFPDNPEVVLNAVRFLRREHPEEAEQLLSRAVERDPGNQKLAVNLGFLYAMDILGMTGAVGDRDQLKQQARLELDRTRNPLVLAGAGVALPNLFPRTPQARDPNGDQSAFELAATLMARAREIAPENAELRGPMPLIREFQQFLDPAAPAPAQLPQPDVVHTNADGSRIAIRVAGEVQASKLVFQPEAIYPPQAKEARIQGTVRFDATIGPDGNVENLTLLSGHPLLVPAAMEAVRRYRYQPTLLNGQPVQVIAPVTVSFVMSN